MKDLEVLDVSSIVAGGEILLLVDMNDIADNHCIALIQPHSHDSFLPLCIENALYSLDKFQVKSLTKSLVSDYSAIVSLSLPQFGGVFQFIQTTNECVNPFSVIRKSQILEVPSKVTFQSYPYNFFSISDVMNCSFETMTEQLQNIRKLSISSILSIQMCFGDNHQLKKLKTDFDCDRNDSESEKKLQLNCFVDLCEFQVSIVNGDNSDNQLNIRHGIRMITPPNDEQIKGLYTIFRHDYRSPLPACISAPHLRHLLSEKQVFTASFTAHSGLHSLNLQDLTSSVDVGLITVNLPYQDTADTADLSSSSTTLSNDSYGVKAEMVLSCRNCEAVLSSSDSHLTSVKVLPSSVFESMMSEFICCSEAPVNALTAHDSAPAPDTVLIGHQKAFISINPCHIKLDAFDRFVPNSKFSLLHLFYPDAGVISTSIDISRELSSSRKRYANSHDKGIKQNTDKIPEFDYTSTSGHELSYDIRQCHEWLGLARNLECLNPLCRPAAADARTRPSLRSTADAKLKPSISGNGNNSSKDTDNVSLLQLADITFPLHAIDVGVRVSTAESRDSSAQSRSIRQFLNYWFSISPCPIPRPQSPRCNDIDSEARLECCQSEEDLSPLQLLSVKAATEEVLSRTLLHFQSVYGMSAFVLYSNSTDDPQFQNSSSSSGGSGTSDELACTAEADDEVMLIRILSTAYANCPSGSTSELRSGLKVSFQRAKSSILDDKVLVNRAKIPLSSQEMFSIHRLLEVRSRWWSRVQALQSLRNPHGGSSLFKNEKLSYLHI